MADFKKLINDPNNRLIRDVVMSNGETIKIFEPTSEQINEIISFQEKWVSGDDLEISGIDIVKVLFPMLTDIKGIENLADEEIDNIINNPSIALIQVQNHIETIITEVYKTVILSARKKLLETDFQVESYKVNEETFDRAISLAAKEKGVSNLAANIEKATEDIIDADKKQKAKNLVALKEYRDSAQDRVNHYKRMVDARRAEFEGMDDNELIE